MNRINKDAAAHAREFQQLLQQRISGYFHRSGASRYANRTMVFKICGCILLWLITLITIYLVGDSPAYLYAAYCVHGVAALFVIFNIGHDAVHEAISARPWVNDLLGYTFNLVGSNRYSWFLKHNVGHHRHTNVEEKDIDIETSPLFRVSPFSPWKAHYRYQHLYVPFVYCFLSLLLIFVVDFKALLKDQRVPAREWAILISSKVAYLIVLVIAPILLLPFSGSQVLLAFFFMHALVGLVISLVLLPSHFVEHADFYPSMAEAPANWTEHQLRTTIDIAPKSKSVNFLLGGLNTNIAHHIFPGICHVHLVAVTEIVRETAHEFHFPYQSYSITQAIRQHFSYLKKMGCNQSF